MNIWIAVIVSYSNWLPLIESLIVIVIAISGRHSSPMSLSLRVLCVTTTGVTLLCLSLLASVDSSPSIGNYSGLNPPFCGYNRFSYPLDSYAKCSKWHPNFIPWDEDFLTRPRSPTNLTDQVLNSADHSWRSDYSGLPWLCYLAHT